jgi:hypothetical protein
MPNTNFIDHNTVITATYMNQVDSAIFDAIGDGTANGPTTNAEVRTNLSINNVDNTSDANKPISTATQTALNLKSDSATSVQKDTDTGAAQLPVGTTAQQPTGANGKVRYNTTINKYEGYSGSAWSSLGGGATGGGSDEIFVQNGQTVTTDYTVPSGKNAHSVGPITVNSGKTVTISSGSRWVVS